jgi:4-methylaminobutanoate oxidase (formaldehyde-forming)
MRFSNEVGIQTLINGPIPSPPTASRSWDSAPELDNFFVACGFTRGIALRVEHSEASEPRILDGDPGMDPVAIRL